MQLLAPMVQTGLITRDVLYPKELNQRGRNRVHTMVIDHAVIKEGIST